MNLFELLTVLFVVGAGYVVGQHFGDRHGALGWIVGGAAGVALAILIYTVLRRLVGASRSK